MSTSGATSTAELGTVTSFHSLDTGLQRDDAPALLRQLY
jgi:hypothetical protein